MLEAMAFLCRTLRWADFLFQLGFFIDLDRITEGLLKVLR